MADNRYSIFRSPIPRDDIGPDPFELRHNKRKLSIPSDCSLQDIIRRLSPHTKLPESDHPNNAKDMVPDFVHFIWLGRRQLGGKSGKAAIASWKKMNPDKTIIVWTNTVDLASGELYTPDILEERRKWCAEHGVIMLDVDDIFVESGNPNLKDGHGMRMRNGVYYYREILKQNYGAASDILRLEILFIFGGIYSDIDIWNETKALGTVFAPTGILVEPELCNDIIIATPESQEIYNLIGRIRQNYGMNNHELFAENGIASMVAGHSSYNEMRISALTKFLFREVTINRSGPGLYMRQFLENLEKQPTINMAPFERIMANSWLLPSIVINETKENVFKRILSNIIADLNIEDAGILRLDQYAAEIKKYDIALDIIQYLQNKFPEYLNKIEMVKFSDCLNRSSLKTNEFFKCLFSKDYFPNLERDPKFFERNGAYLDKLLEYGIDITSQPNYLLYLRNSCVAPDEFDAYIDYIRRNHPDNHQLLLAVELKTAMEPARIPIFKQAHYGENPQVNSARMNVVIALLKRGYTNGLEYEEKLSSFPKWIMSRAYDMSVAQFKVLVDFCVDKNIKLTTDGEGPSLLEMFNQVFKYDIRNPADVVEMRSYLESKISQQQMQSRPNSIV